LKRNSFCSFEQWSEVYLLNGAGVMIHAIYTAASRLLSMFTLHCNNAIGMQPNRQFNKNGLWTYRVIVSGAVGILLCCAALAFVPFTIYRGFTNGVNAGASSEARLTTQSTPGAPDRLHHRLSLQPEANNQRRRLGQRFLATGREVSVLGGVVTL